jgi:hypothetical protein
MEVLACLWSYDDRWMFELRFSKVAWLTSFFFQLLICLACFPMLFASQDFAVWLGFRVMLSLGSALACFLTFPLKSKASRSQGSLESFVALLGLLNLMMTWLLNSHSETSETFRFCAAFQVAAYWVALAPALVTVVGCVFVKGIFLLVALVAPRKLVKVRV